MTDTITSTQTWTCPAGVTSVDVECWGGGGGGGGAYGSSNSGGGGGGGAYSEKLAITVVPSTGYTATVGTGGARGTGDPATNGSVGQDSWFSTTGTVLAKGGGGGKHGLNGGTGGTGGATGSGVGDTKTAGGNGATKSGVGAQPGGGGGGGGGDAAGGGNASVPTAGTGGTSNGGAGATGGSAGSEPSGTGNVRGGGGGGAGNSGGSTGVNGSAGGRGEIRITYTVGGGSAVLIPTLLLMGVG